MGERMEYDFVESRAAWSLHARMFIQRHGVMVRNSSRPSFTGDREGYFHRIAFIDVISSQSASDAASHWQRCDENIVIDTDFFRGPN